MMKERYEILMDCSPFESFEKSREGLEQAIDRVEELLLEGSTPSEQLHLIYIKQDELGEIIECNDVYEVKPLDMRGMENDFRTREQYTSDLYMDGTLYDC